MERCSFAPALDIKNDDTNLSLPALDWNALEIKIRLVDRPKVKRLRSTPTLIWPGEMNWLYTDGDMNLLCTCACLIWWYELVYANAWLECARNEYKMGWQWLQERTCLDQWSVVIRFVTMTLAMSCRSSLWPLIFEANVAMPWNGDFAGHVILNRNDCVPFVMEHSKKFHEWFVWRYLWPWVSFEMFVTWFAIKNHLAVRCICYLHSVLSLRLVCNSFFCACTIKPHRSMAFLDDTTNE